MYDTISLFSGAMGLDLGLESIGFRTRICVEINAHCYRTIQQNRPYLPVIFRNIQEVTTQEVLEAAGLKSEEVFLICGGPPCQPFSTAGKRKSTEDPRGNLFKDFIRFVEEIRPSYFLMENVRGILSAAIKHRPLDKRGKTNLPLEDDETLGSVLEIILDEFQRIGYTVTYKLVNAANYGVPQSRERVLFLGSKDGQKIPFPPETHAKKPSGGMLPWMTLGEAFEGLEDSFPQYQSYSETRAKLFDMILPGKNWRSLPQDVQSEALGGAYNSTGGRVGFYRRLSFDKPSPTIITSMIQKASGMCHPVETRPLSVLECKTLQQFPVDWQISGNLLEQYRQIGNAVPIGLGKVMGEAILRAEKEKEECVGSPIEKLDIALLQLQSVL